MKQNIKKRWLKNLRSGKFKQCKELLRKGKGADVSCCCLGVLTAIAVKEGGVCPAEVAYTDYQTLHPDVRYWAGLDASNPTVRSENGVRVKLSHLNDRGRNFKYIAKLIEKSL